MLSGACALRAIAGSVPLAKAGDLRGDDLSIAEHTEYETRSDIHALNRTRVAHPDS